MAMLGLEPSGPITNKANRIHDSWLRAGYPVKNAQPEGIPITENIITQETGVSKSFRFKKDKTVYVRVFSISIVLGVILGVITMVQTRQGNENLAVATGLICVVLACVIIFSGVALLPGDDSGGTVG